jgi:integrase/recombinase XerD
MSVFDSFPTTPVVVRADAPVLDEAQLAAVAFLARYRGRTLDSYRADLRQFFQWAATVGVPPLQASRVHIELYRAWLDDRGLAATTVDRRLSTVCGYYRFAHIDGRIGSNPAQYVRRPRVSPTTRRGMERGERRLLVHRRADLTDPRRAGGAVGVERAAGQRSLRRRRRGSRVRTRASHAADRRQGSKPATIPLVPRTARTLDLAIGERTVGPILRRHDGRRLDPRTAHRWVQAIGTRAGVDQVHPHMLRAAFIMAALDAGVPLRDVHQDPAQVRRGAVPSGAALK